uniref:Protein S100 n=6 Tax=Bovinae TaxID=27592 RepID=A0A4W2DGV6_BOBOX
MAKVSSPTETERCIESLIAVFQKHAGRDGNNSKLSKAEFLIFMNTELGAFTKNQKDPGVLDRMMKKLDLNSDGQLDFQEFLNLIGGLAIACHESFIKSASSQKRTPFLSSLSVICSSQPQHPLSPAHPPTQEGHSC